MKRWTAVLLVGMIVLSLTAAAFAEENWICPQCGRENPGRANFCGSCRTPKPEAPAPAGVTGNAWVCSSCGEVCPDEDSFCMICGTARNPGDRAALLVKPAELAVLSPLPAETETYQGAFRAEGDQQSIRYTAPVTGTYHLWLAEADSGFSARLEVRDARNDRIGISYTARGGGTTVELEAGQEYQLEIGQDRSLGSYTVMLGIPREWIALDGRQIIEDSISYTDQQNRYLLYAPYDGNYRFQIDKARNGLTFCVTVQDAQGYRISRGYIGQDGGVTAELKAGNTYGLYVEQYIDLGGYTLSVGMAPQPLNVTGCGVLGDRVYFYDQENTYEYEAPVSGDCTFTLAKAPDGTMFEVGLRDDGGYRLTRYFLGQDGAFSVPMTQGRKYTLYVRQYIDLGDYVLNIEY